MCRAANRTRARRPWRPCTASWTRSWAYGPWNRGFLTDVEAVAALEGVPMRMSLYGARLAQVPRPAAELAHLRWITGHETDIRIAPAVRDHVLPMLWQGRLTES